jgi:hypothetical protein
MIPPDEVCDDFLQAETDADAHRAAEHGEHGKIDADRAQHNNDRDGHHAMRMSLPTRT